MNCYPNDDDTPQHSPAAKSMVERLAEFFAALVMLATFLYFAGGLCAAYFRGSIP